MPRTARLLATLVAGALLAGPAPASAASSGTPGLDRTAQQRLLRTLEAAEPLRAPAACAGTTHSSGTDGTALDARAYGVHADCMSPGSWYVEVRTHDTWAPSSLQLVDLFADTDGRSATGCGGFERYVLGGWSSSAGRLVAGVFSTPTCDQAGWTQIASARIGATSDGVALGVRHTDLGGGRSLTWYAGIAGTGETVVEELPETGAHTETVVPVAVGPDGCPLSGSAWYATTGDPDAVADLRAAGLDDVRRLRGGVVAFEGDPDDARRVLGTPVRRDAARRLHAVPGDPQAASQWALPAVRAGGAWDLGRGSRDVVVAVIDSGVDATHPDLQGQLLPGWDATTSSPLAPGDTDPNGHGTASAGVVAAATDNGTGLASLGWNTRVLPIKVEGPDGTIRVSAVVSALTYAADAGVDVVNLSLGSCQADDAEKAAVQYAQDRGVLVVASAGNEALKGNPVEYPAAYPGVLAVGATRRDDTRAAYSNTGSYVDLVAPGGAGTGSPDTDVLLLDAGTGGTTAAAGTSFSSPLVAAAAALVKAARPTLRGTALGDVLTATARDAGAPGHDTSYGAGLLDAAAALRAVVPAQVPPAAPAPPATTAEPQSPPSTTPGPSATPADTPSPSPSATPSATPSADPSASPSAGPGGPSPSPDSTPTPDAPAPTSAPTSAPPAAPSSPTPASASPAADAAAPTLRLARSPSLAGSPVDVTVRTSPGARVELLAYSRPSTTYAVVRTGAADGTGTARFTVSPTTTSRLHATATSASGRPVVGASEVLLVSPRVTVAAERTARLAYRFGGAVAPGRPGVTVTVYHRAAGGALTRLAVTRTGSGGRWSLDRRFGRGAALTVVARTSPDATHAAGTSAPRRVVVR